MRAYVAGPARPARLVAMVALLWFGLAGWAWAAERASISSSVGGAIYYTKDGWIAVGGVILTQGEIQISADRMNYDPDAEKAVFSGNVRVSRGADVIEGAAFVYDLGTGTGRVEEAVATFDIEGFSSPVYLMGEFLEFGEGYGAVENARFTTCYPPAKAGYYLASRRIDVFPGDRMVVRSVRFVESGLTLFYWPYLSISLNDDRPSDIRLPEIGYNDSDGWYVKTRFGYDGPGEGRGEVAIDWFQNKGIGTGVSHVYRTGEQGEGRLSAYRLANRATDHIDLALGWQERFRLRGAGVDWQAAYFTERGSTGGEQHEGRYELSLDGRPGRHPGDVEWEAVRRWGDDRVDTDRLRVGYSGSESGWRWRADVDVFSVRPVPSRIAYAYTLNLRRSQGPYTLNVDVERRMHSLYFTRNAGSPAWQLRTTLPSVELDVDLAGAVSPRLPADLEVGWARLSEARRVGSEYPLVAADRTTLALRLHPGSVRLGALGDLYFRAGAEYRGYTSGERRLILSANHQYRLPIGRSWALYGGYSYQEALGDPSPFSFDDVSQYERVTGRLQYAFTQGNAFVSTGYDFRTGLLSDVVGQLSYRPAAGGLLAVQGGYSLQQAAPTYMSANVSLNPSSNFGVTASARYDFEERLLESLSAGLTAAYLGWKLEYETTFDLDADGGASTQVALLRDLGCREIGLRYDSDAGSVWLEYRITALPGEGLRFGADRGGLLFDAESIASFF